MHKKVLLFSVSAGAGHLRAADALHKVLKKRYSCKQSRALARGLPLCVVNPIPGQEERYNDRLLEAGAAIRCNNLPTLSWKLDQLISDPIKIASLKQKAKEIGRPNAARQIVENLVGE